jgi:hypothetical protein
MSELHSHWLLSDVWRSSSYLWSFFVKVGVDHNTVILRLDKCIWLKVCFIMWPNLFWGLNLFEGWGVSCLCLAFFGFLIGSLSSSLVACFMGTTLLQFIWHYLKHCCWQEAQDIEQVLKVLGLVQNRAVSLLVLQFKSKGKGDCFH